MALFLILQTRNKNGRKIIFPILWKKYGNNAYLVFAASKNITGKCLEL
jgi:hypothetical protein